MEDKEFDSLMRSTLEGGQEEVPAGLWSAIEGKLPSAVPAARKTPVVWWKWASCAAAAACVAAVAVVFSTRTPSSPAVDIADETAPIVAQAVEEEQPVETPADTYVPTQIRKAETFDTVTTEEPDPETEAEVVEEVADESAAATERKANDNWLSKYETGTFDENGTEAVEKAAKTRKAVSIGAFADAASNTNPTFEKTASTVMRAPTVPTVTSIEETSESRYAIPVSAGIGIRIPVTERISIGTGINWSLLSRTFAGQYNKVDDNGILTSTETYSSIRNTQNYIGIPLDVYYSIVSKDFLDFYTYAGGSASKCITNRYSMSGPDGNTVYRSPDTGWQYSANIGLGVEFIAAKRLGFYIDPSLSWWFSDGKATNIRTRQPLMMNLEVGMRIRL